MSIVTLKYLTERDHSYSFLKQIYDRQRFMLAAVFIAVPLSSSLSKQRIVGYFRKPAFLAHGTAIRIY
jgi:hypothetical protein